jgi:hypothetical protein
MVANDVTYDDVVVYNNVITSQGPGSSLLFALELGELLYDDMDKAKSLAIRLRLDRNDFRRAVTRGHKRQVPHELHQAASERAPTKADAMESQPPPTPTSPTVDQHKGQATRESSNSKRICKRHKCNGATLRKADECAVSFEYSEPQEDEASQDCEESENDEDEPTVAVLGIQEPRRNSGVRFDFPLVQSRVWTPLEEMGWTTDTPGECLRLYYQPRGRSFITLADVINFIRTNVEWKDREEIREVIAAYDEISGNPTGIGTTQRASSTSTNGSGVKSHQRGSESSLVPRNGRKTERKPGTVKASRGESTNDDPFSSGRSQETVRVVAKRSHKSYQGHAYSPIVSTRAREVDTINVRADSRRIRQPQILNALAACNSAMQSKRIRNLPNRQARFKLPEKAQDSSSSVRGSVAIFAFEQLWMFLETLGWRYETRNYKHEKRIYYYPPGVNQKLGRNRVGYFDSKIQVLVFLRSENQWKDRPEVVEALVAYNEVFVAYNEDSGSPTGIGTARELFASDDSEESENDEDEPTVAVICDAKDEQALSTSKNSSGVKRQRESDSSLAQRNDRKTSRKPPDGSTGKSNKITTSRTWKGVNHVLLADTLVKTLLTLGWRIESENKRKYYIPPGKNRKFRYECGVDYFDTLTHLVKFVSSDSEWKDRIEIRDAMVAYESALQKQTLRKQALASAVVRKKTPMKREPVREPSANSEPEDDQESLPPFHGRDDDSLSDDDQDDDKFPRGADGDLSLQEGVDEAEQLPDLPDDLSGGPIQLPDIPADDETGPNTTRTSGRRTRKPGRFRSSMKASLELIAAYDDVSSTGIGTTQRALSTSTNSSGVKRQRCSDSSLVQQRYDRNTDSNRDQTTGKRRKIATSSFAEPPAYYSPSRLRVNHVLLADTLVKTLLTLGWRIDSENKRKYYIPPGKNRKFGHECGVDYFDTLTHLVHFVSSDSEWKDRIEIRDAMVAYKSVLQRSNLFKKTSRSKKTPFSSNKSRMLARKSRMLARKRRSEDADFADEIQGVDSEVHQQEADFSGGRRHGGIRVSSLEENSSTGSLSKCFSAHGSDSGVGEVYGRYSSK